MEEWNKQEEMTRRRRNAERDHPYSTRRCSNCILKRDVARRTKKNYTTDMREARSCSIRDEKTSPCTSAPLYIDGAAALGPVSGGPPAGGFCLTGGRTRDPGAAGVAGEAGRGRRRGRGKEREREECGEGRGRRRKDS